MNVKKNQPGHKWSPKTIIRRVRLGQCPFCASDQTAYESEYENNAGLVSQRAECMACEKQWYENFKIFGITEIV